MYFCHRICLHVLVYVHWHLIRSGSVYRSHRMDLLQNLPFEAFEVDL